MPIAINPKFAVGSVPICDLSCQHGGYCNVASTDEHTLLQLSATGAMIEHCVCPPGYTGIACENKAVVGVGDCSEADAVSDFAGRMCREPATSYCGEGGVQNRSYCTNGGLCKDNLVENKFSVHHGCRCPHEFEGPHCEYLKATAPDTISMEFHLLGDQSNNNPTSDIAESKITTLTLKAAVVPTVPVQGNASMAPQNNGISANVGIILGIAMSTFGVAILAHHRRRSKRPSSDCVILDRACYKDETPIASCVMGELEIEEYAVDGYFDDNEEDVDDDEDAEEDLHSISGRSLEEIEAEHSGVISNYREYLQNIRDGGYVNYFDSDSDD